MQPLVDYFKSGWAFLVPYLASYLIYAWLGLPVNPLGVEAHGGSTPCLLRLFWVLHAIHIVLAGIALGGGWTRSIGGHSARPDLWPLLPWVCLGLIFWIPGVYLEFPADPWQHFGRINEWSALHFVTEHSYWRKFSYFLAYSWIGKIAPTSLQLEYFRVYYSACCLLLGWQYYRLSRAVGLNGPSSFIFVLLQSLLSGNDVFGFSRYYGMSSSVFAQIGAVALVRVAVEAPFLAPPPMGGEARNLPSESLRFVARIGLLVVLTAFSHVQGLGIAALGIAGVVVWRLIRRHRLMIWWLPSFAVLLSVMALLWWPRHPLTAGAYLKQGWFTPWMGFNLFSPTSPAFDRALQITGVLGCGNLLAGLWLLRRNHIVAWLTVMPVVLLSLPFIAIPFANSLAADREIPGGYIIAFHRMLFAIPSGLALVVVFGEAVEKQGRWRIDGRGAMVSVGLALLVLMPAGQPYFNRLYNALMIPPADLSLRHITGSPLVETMSERVQFQDSGAEPAQIFLARGSYLTTPGIGYALNATGVTMIAGARKWITWPTLASPAFTTSVALENLEHVDSDNVHFVPFWPSEHLFSAYSITGSLSNHWLPAEVALIHAGQRELFAPVVRQSGKRRSPQIWLEWFDPRNGEQVFAKGAGTPIDSGVLDDRGALVHRGVAEIHVGDRLVLRPVLHTPDGNGYRVALGVRGPQFHTHQDFFGPPRPLGGDSWIYGDSIVIPSQPGEYTIEIVGTAVWPNQEHVVRYHFLTVP